MKISDKTTDHLPGDLIASPVDKVSEELTIVLLLFVWELSFFYHGCSGMCVLLYENS